MMAKTHDVNVHIEISAKMVLNGWHVKTKWKVDCEPPHHTREMLVDILKGAIKQIQEVQRGRDQ